MKVNDETQTSIHNFDITFQLYMAMRRICKIQEHIRARVGKNVGLTDAQYYLIRALALCDTRLSYSKLAHLTGLSHNSVSTLIKGLIKSGLVQQHPCPHDGRVTELSLSENGLKVVHELFTCDEEQLELIQQVTTMVQDEDLIGKLNTLHDFSLEFLKRITV
ncbi:MarR family winged helix-turn-helix transcriptional regulator [Alicyclobacillus sp. ALC3]|uniref:MarR family winged helix-turn-helix transcriptional regulator n=1 Tax=Alicyclobacillus sp. ALC3 TaxID=2796143 RepID=UPI0023793462|nr:MarR family transcriptional regulator [Alicyclobacillus sp. ALC3]WDL96061.1 MarR family transcriptional regulator [Alicyclobacillus sp. ALC3]